MPVFGTMAARFNDDGVTALYQALVPALRGKGLKLQAGKLPPVSVKQSSASRAIVPTARGRYLAEIADAANNRGQTTVFPCPRHPDRCRRKGGFQTRPYIEFAWRRAAMLCEKTVLCSLNRYRHTRAGR